MVFTMVIYGEYSGPELVHIQSTAKSKLVPEVRDVSRDEILIITAS
jgi:hypothetical protein